MDSLILNNQNVDYLTNACIFLSPLSGGFIYFSIEDLYQIYIKKTRHISRPLKFRFLLNYGFIIGGLFGYVRYKTQMSVIDAFFYMVKNI